MIKYLDDFYRELYAQYNIRNGGVTWSYEYYFRYVFRYTPFYSVIDAVRKYPIIILVFEKYYCKYNTYKTEELVYFINIKNVLSFQNEILYELRLNKIKKLME